MVEAENLKKKYNRIEMCIARDYLQTDKHLFCYFYIPSQKCSFKSLQKPDLLPLPGDENCRIAINLLFIF